ncbi:poly polymerase protein [Diaporthe amygdali]|uniref:poly polymerase protein n=1 Tax=Phomopsis amygdali TaxID=1214568 RepID=UPI0022FF1B8F|nr:poly polymerase protein [Diaporthe amygdali]KAJ0122505.1 poly polymerase protein [Diaporthe amygdali]
MCIEPLRPPAGDSDSVSREIDLLYNSKIVEWTKANTEQPQQGLRLWLDVGPWQQIVIDDMIEKKICTSTKPLVFDDDTSSLVAQSEVQETLARLNFDVSQIGIDEQPPSSRECLKDRPRSLKPAEIVGYHIQMWWPYPVLIDGPPGNVAKGTAYEIKGGENKDKLAHYETNNYKDRECIVRLGTESKISDTTFDSHAYGHLDRSLPNSDPNDSLIFDIGKGTTFMRLQHGISKPIIDAFEESPRRPTELSGHATNIPAETSVGR